MAHEANPERDTDVIGASRGGRARLESEHTDGSSAPRLTGAARERSRPVRRDSRAGSARGVKSATTSAERRWLHARAPLAVRAGMTCPEARNADNGRPSATTLWTFRAAHRRDIQCAGAWEESWRSERFWPIATGALRQAILAATRQATRRRGEPAGSDQKHRRGSAGALDRRPGRQPNMGWRAAPRHTFTAG